MDVFELNTIAIGKNAAYPSICLYKNSANVFGTIVIAPTTGKPLKSFF